MLNTLEKYYKSIGNIVIRDANGNPSVYVRHPKIKSSEFDSLLPEHTHPAFIVNDEEDDAVLIGKYENSVITPNGILYSLPNAEPDACNGMLSTDPLSRMRAAGENVSGITIADLGLLNLMVENKPDMFQKMDGNIRYGSGETNYNNAPMYEFGVNVTKGAERHYKGWLYRCLISHKTSKDLPPENTPAYWEKIKKVGGTVYAPYINVYPDARSDDKLGGPTLTGSGPIEWYFMCDPANEADLIGNFETPIYGIHIRGNEICIMPNNDAANPNADLLKTSDSWRAILPHSTDNGYDLVAPGTAGTLRIALVDNKSTIIAREATADEIQNINTATKGERNGFYVDSLTVPYVPCILYELGLVALPAKTNFITWSFAISNTDANVRSIRISSHISSKVKNIRISAQTVDSVPLSTLCATRSRAREKAVE